MIGKIVIELPKEFTLETKDGEILPGWLSTLALNLREAVERDMDKLQKNENINVDVDICVSKLPKAMVSEVLQSTIKNVIYDVMDKHGKEVKAFSCGYDFLRNTSRIEVEIF